MSSVSINIEQNEFKNNLNDCWHFFSFTTHALHLRGILANAICQLYVNFFYPQCTAITFYLHNHVSISMSYLQIAALCKPKVYMFLSNIVSLFKELSGTWLVARPLYSPLMRFLWKMTRAFKSDLHACCEKSFPIRQLFKWLHREMCPKKVILAPPVFLAGTIRSLGFLPFPTMNQDFLFTWVHSPLYTIKVIFHIIRHKNLNKFDLCNCAKEPREVFALAGWLTVRWRCAQGVWSGWRWRDRRNLEPTWRTWTPPHTRRDLEKMETRVICGAPRICLSGTIIWNCLKMLTCKFDMELIFWFEYLNIKGAVWGKVLHCPGSQDRLMVLMETVLVLHLYPWRKKKEFEFVAVSPQPYDPPRYGCLKWNKPRRYPSCRTGRWESEKTPQIMRKCT